MFIHAFSHVTHSTPHITLGKKKFRNLKQTTDFRCKSKNKLLTLIRNFVRYNNPTQIFHKSQLLGQSTLITSAPFHTPTLFTKRISLAPVTLFYSKPRRKFHSYHMALNAIFILEVEANQLLSLVCLLVTKALSPLAF